MATTRYPPAVSSLSSASAKVATTPSSAAARTTTCTAAPATTTSRAGAGPIGWGEGANDTFSARSGSVPELDRVSGGAGSDKAIVDNLDLVWEVEQITVL